MTYSEVLAGRARGLLAAHEGVTECKMFGGIAFLLDGKMSVGVMDDDLMVRTGTHAYEEALHRPGARPMDFTGRISKGMVFVAPKATSRDADLRRWIDVGVRAAVEAPSKRQRPRPPQRRAK